MAERGGVEKPALFAVTRLPTGAARPEKSALKAFPAGQGSVGVKVSVIGPVQRHWPGWADASFTAFSGVPARAKLKRQRETASRPNRASQALTSGVNVIETGAKGFAP